MTTSSAAGVPGVEIQPGRSPILYVDGIADPEALRAFVAEHGSLYVRGLDLQSPGQVEATFRSFGALVTEREAFAPRKEYAQGVYSASQWPPNQPMCMHHELSYVLEPPSLMLFACLTAPLANGATTLADAATILDALPIDLVDRFDRVGWQLVRTYNEDIGASLPEAFGTSDHRIIESYCRAHDRFRMARRRAAHAAAPERHCPPPRHRAALLVQPDRIPQRMDAGTRGAGVSRGRLRRRRVAVQHAVRRWRADRPRRRPTDQRGIRGEHAARAVAARRPAARGQCAHRTRA